MYVRLYLYLLLDSKSVIHAVLTPYFGLETCANMYEAIVEEYLLSTSQSKPASHVCDGEC